MSRRRYTQSVLTPASSVISEVISSNQRIREGMTLGYILSHLNDIFGDKFGNNVRPVELKNGRLLIFVPDPVWLNDIQFYKEEIKSRINRFIREDVVREIKFSLKPAE